MNILTSPQWLHWVFGRPMVSGLLMAVAMTMASFFFFVAFSYWQNHRDRIHSWHSHLLLMRRALHLPTYGILLVIVCIGLILRLAVALHPGYGFDVGTNQGWAWTGAVNGVTTSYTEQLHGTMIPDYPPFSLMIFTSVGEVYRLFADEREAHPVLYRVLIKLPAIISDLLIVITMFFLLSWLKHKRAGMLAALTAALHPAIWYNSSAWGQTDVIFTLFTLLSLLTLGLHRSILGGALGAVALFTKLHAIAFYPLLLIATRLRWRSILRSIGGGLIMFTIIFTPFFIAGSGQQALESFVKVIGSYQMVSANAYNFWWALMDQAAWDRPSTQLLLGPLTYRSVGQILMWIAYVLVLWPAWRLLRSKVHARITTEALLATGAVCAFAFFLFNTEMHERYLFPFTIFGLPLIFFHRSYRLPYWGATLAYLLNLMSFLRAPDAIGWLFETFPTIDSAIASLQVIFFILLLKRVRTHSLHVPPMGKGPLGSYVRTCYARTRSL